MIDFIFNIVFPLTLLGLIIIILLSGLSNRKSVENLMSLDEFIRDWLNDHGQSQRVEDQLQQMKRDPSGKIYMPITYKGAKVSIKWGLSPNKVSVINLLLSFLIFYSVIVAGRGQALDLFTQQPAYGSWFFLIALLVLFTGIIDGVDGGIARLLKEKTKSGAWFDNVIDRVSDILMLVCLVPGNLMFLPDFNLNFDWLVWTNIFIIFIYEYMRARHQGLGLHEDKPYPGERITRILIIATFFVIYGISSFSVFLTSLIDPSAVNIWAVSHLGVTSWTMLILQITLFAIMTFSSIQLARYSFRNLKKMDKEN
ncbi:MAG: hypothetical protein GF317_17615 [Candidatus Lokiarchaeota archaeon]|nr:hypothetical protein [Candidatus Lokiarchaeota archaeon]MBD3201337.1 hypothetical protein [Candidatus Lokiarchaeota archaeon]